MCGIVYVNRHDGKSAVKSVKKRYHNQKARGSEGFGYVAIKNNVVVAVERAETEHEIMQKLSKETAPEILFHHRMPTSTPNVREAAHPIYVKNKLLEKQYLIVHNGVISNSRARKEEHEKLGFVYTTELKEALQSTKTGELYFTKYSKFNDSEALAIDTALALEGLEKNIESEGAAAVIGLQLAGNVVVGRFFYRNTGNPLRIGKDKMMTSLTSVGGEVDISPISIMQFDASHSVVTHPANVWVPLSYRYPTPGSASTRNYDYETEDSFGFVPRGGSALLPAPQEPIIEWGDVDTYVNEFDPVKLKGTVKGMRDEILWEEYETVTNVLISLENASEIIDTAVGDNAADMGDAIRRRKLLQTRIDKNKNYQEILEAEIKEREVFSRKINTLL